MQLKLDLTKHCIETELKRLYNRSVSEYLKKKSTDILLEQRIENLMAALESLDFGTLRKDFPVLAGHHDGEVILSFDGKNKPNILINGQSIEYSQ